MLFGVNQLDTWAARLNLYYTMLIVLNKFNSIKKKMYSQAETVHNPNGLFFLHARKAADFLNRETHFVWFIALSAPPCNGM